MKEALGLPVLGGGAEGDALVLDDVPDAEAVGDHRAKAEEAQRLCARGVGVWVWADGGRVGVGGWCGAVCPRGRGGCTGLPQLEVEMVVWLSAAQPWSAKREGGGAPSAAARRHVQ